MRMNIPSGPGKEPEPRREQSTMVSGSSPSPPTLGSALQEGAGSITSTHVSLLVWDVLPVQPGSAGLMG